MDETIAVQWATAHLTIETVLRIEVPVSEGVSDRENVLFWSLPPPELTNLRNGVSFRDV
jgi:hypothetical protein